jgi:hypothetical protein
VGRTIRAASGRRAPPEHPHGRGEDFGVPQKYASYGGTPPQVWGGLLVRDRDTRADRNTPTGVGDCRFGKSRISHHGTPPPGVGRTSGRTPVGSVATEHPHRRGEDAAAAALTATRTGTPPQAWGGPSRPAEMWAQFDWRQFLVGVSQTPGRPPDYVVPICTRSIARTAPMRCADDCWMKRLTRCPAPYRV